MNYLLNLILAAALIVFVGCAEETNFAEESFDGASEIQEPTDPPVGNPPADPPADPPAQDPPAEDPPAEDPPAEDPPAEEVPIIEDEVPADEEQPADEEDEEPGGTGGGVTPGGDTGGIVIPPTEVPDEEDPVEEDPVVEDPVVEDEIVDEISDCFDADTGNILCNGSFEEPVIRAGSWKYYSNEEDIPGWKFYTGSNMELRNKVAGIAYDGEQFIELDSHKYDFGAENIGIYQDVALEIGEEYVLSFYYQPRGKGKDNNFKVVINGVEEAFNPEDAAWEKAEINFIADAAVGNIGFIYTGRRDTFGAHIDNIVLALAPEPEPEPEPEVVVPDPDPIVLPEPEVGIDCDKFWNKLKPECTDFVDIIKPLVSLCYANDAGDCEVDEDDQDVVEKTVTFNTCSYESAIKIRSDIFGLGEYLDVDFTIDGAVIGEVFANLGVCNDDDVFCFCAEEFDNIDRISKIGIKINGIGYIEAELLLFLNKREEIAQNFHFKAEVVFESDYKCDPKNKPLINLFDYTGIDWDIYDTSRNNIAPDKDQFMPVIIAENEQSYFGKKGGFFFCKSDLFYFENRVNDSGWCVATEDWFCGGRSDQDFDFVTTYEAEETLDDGKARITFTPLSHFGAKNVNILKLTFDTDEPRNVLITTNKLNGKTWNLKHCDKSVPGNGYGLEKKCINSGKKAAKWSQVARKEIILEGNDYIYENGKYIYEYRIKPGRQIFRNNTAEVFVTISYVD